MSSWSAIEASWDRSWKAVQDAALRQWRSAIEASPERFRSRVEGFLGLLTQTRLSLDEALQMARRPQATAADRASYLRLQSRYNEVAAGIMAHATPSEQVSGVPVLLVAGLAVGVAGVAWAMAAYEYAASLRDQVQLYREDLAARVQATQQGVVLPPSTVPAPPVPPSPPPTPGSIWPWLLGAGAVGLGGLAFLVFREK